MNKSNQIKDILKEITSQDIAMFNNSILESRNIDNFLAEKINEIIRVVNKKEEVCRDIQLKKICPKCGKKMLKNKKESSENNSIYEHCGLMLSIG